MYVIIILRFIYYFIKAPIKFFCVEVDVTNLGLGYVVPRLTYELLKIHYFSFNGLM